MTFRSNNLNYVNKDIKSDIKIDRYDFEYHNCFVSKSGFSEILITF